MSDESELSAPPGSEPQFSHLKPGMWVVAQGAGWESGDLGSRSVWDVSPCVILGPWCALLQEGLVSSHGRGRGSIDSNAKTSGPEAGEGHQPDRTGMGRGLPMGGEWSRIYVFLSCF